MFTSLKMCDSVNTRIYKKLSRRLRCFLSLSLVAMLIGGGNDVSATENRAPIPYKNTVFSRLPSITALLKQYSLRDETVVQSSWVVLSPQGIHVSDTEGTSEVLKSFDSKRIWMIDRKRKLYYALEVEQYQEEYPELAANLFSQASATNLMGQTACEGWFGEFIGERIWRGQVVQEWHCTDEQQVLVNKQYLSTHYGLVIRVQSASLAVDELTDIKPQANNDYVFEPPASFYSVPKNQFINDQIELQRYKSP